MGMKIKKNGKDFIVPGPRRITDSNYEYVKQYITDSQQALPEHRRRHDSVDAGYFFERELEFIYAETLMEETAGATSLRIFEIDSTPPEGATKYVQRIFAPVGETKIISDFSTALPRVTVVKKEETRNIEYLGNAFDYNIAEIAAAAMTGEPLQREKAFSSRESTELAHDRYNWFGAADSNIHGALNNNDISRYIMSVKLDESASPADQLNELNAFVNSINEQAQGNLPNNSLTLVLPPEEYGYLMSEPLSVTNGSNVTIGEFLIQKNPFLSDITQSWAVGDSDSIDSGKRCAFLFRRGFQYARVVAPVIYRQEPVQRVNLTQVINTIGKTGGFYSAKPVYCLIGELAD